MFCQGADQKKRFRSTAKRGRKFKVHLEIFLNEEAARGVDLDNLVDLFKMVGKQKHDGKKVTVTVMNTFPLKGN